MAKKLYDLAVKTGSYEKNGETKGRYENIGAVMEGGDGNKFLMVKRSFNPAGVPFKEGSDAILVSMFTPKARDGEQRAEPAGSSPDPNDDIPF